MAVLPGAARADRRPPAPPRAVAERNGHGGAHGHGTNGYHVNGKRRPAASDPNFVDQF